MNIPQTTLEVIFYRLFAGCLLGFYGCLGFAIFLYWIGSFFNSERGYELYQFRLPLWGLPIVNLIYSVGYIIWTFPKIKAIELLAYFLGLYFACFIVEFGIKVTLSMAAMDF